jgi:hypothetical protein
MQQSATAPRIWFARIRTVAAWTTLVAFVSMFAAENILTSKYGARSWPDPAARPSLLEWLLFWRNGSLVLALATGLISLPRWQSWVGLALTIAYTYFLVTSY